ncbi:MAG TPA: hypothetical protein VGC81_10525 [Candidatus Methylomirabilis sp.]
MAKSKSQKIWKDGKVEGYKVPTPDGGSIIVRGGQGKQGHIGRIKPEKKK